MNGLAGMELLSPLQPGSASFQPGNASCGSGLTGLAGMERLSPLQPGGASVQPDNVSKGSGADEMAGTEFSSPFQPDGATVPPGKVSVQSGRPSSQHQCAIVQPGSASVQPGKASGQPGNASVQPFDMPAQPPSAVDDTAGSGTVAAARVSPNAGEAAPAVQQLLVVRPLLEVSRATLRQLLLDENLPWIDDPTNADRSFSRNAIRS